MKLVNNFNKQVLFVSILFVVYAVYPKVTEAKPNYPQSNTFTSVTWQPASEIIRLAPGSDNWPTTWASDGQLYGAGGDGFGCDGSGTKWSLWIGKISGFPTDITCADIAHLYTEDGQSGEKGSGIVSIEGRLYMWLRNANNKGHQCGLVWSDDLGKTWTTKKIMFPEFGYCTFLNFGQNYDGARDNYVYTYTHDNSSAYSSADHFVLIRVPKDQVTNLNSYEFFSGTSENPSWSSDITKRTSVFTHTDNALRSGISYHASTGRYLWWQQNGAGGPDTRRSGGFGIYDAPEPWGPWSVVYYTDNWDVGPGDTGHFPSKWMSSDGTYAYLVFSGNDYFSVRRADFTLNTNPTPQPTNPSPTPTPTATPTTLIPGDANGDGKVDGLDYIVWLNHYDTATPNGSLDGDFDGNGFVDGLDYLVWLNNYGSDSITQAPAKIVSHLHL